MSTGKGYISGGTFNSLNVKATDAVYYSSNTAAHIAAELSTAKFLHTGINSFTNGYFVGGRNNISYQSGYYNSIDAINFSTETAIPKSVSLATGTSGLAGISNPSTNAMNNGTALGFLVGGESGYANNVTTISIFNFSNETISTNSYSFLLQNQIGQALSALSGPIKGYISNGTYISSIDYSSGTVTPVTTSIGNQISAATTSNNINTGRTNSGYFIGGLVGNYLYYPNYKAYNYGYSGTTGKLYISTLNYDSNTHSSVNISLGSSKAKAGSTGLSSASAGLALSGCSPINGVAAFTDECVRLVYNTLTYTITSVSVNSVEYAAGVTTQSTLAPITAPPSVTINKSINTRFDYTLPGFTCSETNNVFTYSLSGSTPTGITVTGLSAPTYTPPIISGTATETGTSVLTYRATDLNGSYAESTVTLNMLPNVPNAPSTAVTLPNTLTHKANTAFSITLNPFTHRDGLTLTYSMENIPSGLVFNNSDRTISGSVTTPGYYTIKYIATDTNNTSSDVLVRLTIESNYPIPPQPFTYTLNGVDISSTYIELLTNTDYTIVLPEFTDVDSAYGDTLEYFISFADVHSVFSAHFDFDPITRTITGNSAIPTIDPLNSNHDKLYIIISYSAIDSYNKLTSVSLSLAISPQPVISPTIPDIEVYAKAFNSSTLPEVLSPDGFSITYSVTNILPGLSFNPTTRVLSGTVANRGTVGMFLKASTLYTTTSVPFNYVIKNNPSAAPTIDTIYKISGVFITEQLLPFTDIDNDAITYSVEGLPTGLAFDPKLRIISGITTEVGDHVITYKGDDAFGIINPCVFTLTILPKPINAVAPRPIRVALSQGAGGIGGATPSEKIDIIFAYWYRGRWIDFYSTSLPMAATGAANYFYGFANLSIRVINGSITIVNKLTGDTITTGIGKFPSGYTLSEGYFGMYSNTSNIMVLDDLKIYNITNIE